MTTRMCCGPAGSSRISTPMARRSAFPALPVEWNGGNIGEGLKVPVLGADTDAVRAELDEPKAFFNRQRCMRLP